jgi:hypothetical protein
MIKKSWVIARIAEQSAKQDCTYVAKPEECRLPTKTLMCKLKFARPKRKTRLHLCCKTGIMQTTDKTLMCKL